MQWTKSQGCPKRSVPFANTSSISFQKQYRYGYWVFFNINICKNNMDDVTQLTEIARDHGSATDHINESPMLDHPHFKYATQNETFIECEDWEDEGYPAWSRNGLRTAQRIEATPRRRRL